MKRAAREDTAELRDCAHRLDDSAEGEDTRLRLRSRRRVELPVVVPRPGRMEDRLRRVEYLVAVEARRLVRDHPFPTLKTPLPPSPFLLSAVYLLSSCSVLPLSENPFH